MLLQVGELARRTGLTVRTLHHYDAIGLLAPSARSEAGYRLYGPDDIARLHAIQALRLLGLPLAEIGGLLVLLLNMVRRKNKVRREMATVPSAGRLSVSPLTIFFFAPGE